METAVGVSSLLKSLITIYRLIWEQGAQYAESPHKERQTDRLYTSYRLSFSTDGTSWTAKRRKGITRDGHFLVRCQFYLFTKHFLVSGFFCAYAQVERGFTA